MSRALGEAVRFGTIPRNVVALVKPPKDKDNAEGPEDQAKALPPTHARALLEATRDDRLAAFYLLLLTAGLRRGEALGLTWQDVVMPEDGYQTAVIPRPPPAPVAGWGSHARAAEVEILDPAGADPRRHRGRVMVAPRCQRAEFAKLGKGWQVAEFVLTTPEGDSVHRNTIVKQFHARRKAAELPH